MRKREWVRFRRGRSTFAGVGLAVENGFVWQFRPEGPEPFEVLDGAAVVALGLRLIAEKQGPGIGLAGEAVETLGEAVVAILGAGDFEVADEFPGH